MMHRPAVRKAPFGFTKWYFDCVSADGRVVTGYWASVEWGHLAFTWQDIVLLEAGQPAVRRTSLRRAPPPEVAGSTISWRAPALGCLIDVEARQEPIGAQLHRDGEGIVEWRAQAPAAILSVDLQGCAPVRGPGYAERIVLTIPPWRLPIRELRWGRWHDAGADRSVVWIDWRGESPRTWVFVDGRLAPSATVSGDEICAGDARLRIEPGRTLESRSFAQIAGAIAPLRSVVPQSLLALRRTRWCSEAVLSDGIRGEHSGRAIHELAVFA